MRAFHLAAVAGVASGAFTRYFVDVRARRLAGARPRVAAGAPRRHAHAAAAAALAASRSRRRRPSTTPWRWMARRPPSTTSRAPARMPTTGRFTLRWARAPTRRPPQGAGEAARPQRAVSSPSAPPPRVRMQGGGWCYSADDCFGRSKTALGSSSIIPSTVSLGGLLSSNCADSPLCNYNMVYMKVREHICALERCALPLLARSRRATSPSPPLALGSTSTATPSRACATSRSCTTTARRRCPCTSAAAPSSTPSSTRSSATS